MITQKKEIVRETIRAKSRAEAIEKFTQLINSISCEHDYILGIHGIVGGEVISDDKNHTLRYEGENIDNIVEMNILEVFCKDQKPQNAPINWESLVSYLGRKTRTVCKNGIINLQYNTWFLADKGEYVFGEQLLKLLQLAEGKQLDIYWLAGNDGEVIKAFAYRGKKYICELLPQPAYKWRKEEQSEQDLIKLSIVRNYNKTVLDYIRKNGGKQKLKDRY